MADQKFSAVLREAIWIAHSKKCAYTHELVDLASMHVDHIIPETLATKPEEFAAFRAALGLPADFDLFGFENLLPANLQKGDLTLNAAGAHFFLNIAASKKAVIEGNIDKINRRLQSGRAFIMIQQMLESGTIKPADVASLLARPAEEVFTLVEKMEFADKSQVLAVSKAEIAELRTRPIKLGANDHLDGVTLGNDSGEERHVRTCVEYDEALRTGFYARNTFEIKMSVFFEHQCGLLTALAKATLPTESHVAEPRVGLPDLHLLPFSMFPDPAASAGDPPSSTDTSPSSTSPTRPCRRSSAIKARCRRRSRTRI